jgi:hypothetical protein
MVRASLGWVTALVPSCLQTPRVVFLSGTPGKLIQLPALLLAKPFARERLFYPAFLSWLHIEAVLFYFFDDVFLLHFSLETPQSVF